jgi:hypothetical protein
MDDYIYDGEPHALDKDFAYMLKRVEDTSRENVHEITLSFLNKYAEYLYQNDKETVIEYLMNAFQGMLAFDKMPPETSLTYRPPHLVSAIAQFGTIAFKFPRSNEDTLVTP